MAGVLAGDHVGSGERLGCSWAQVSEIADRRPYYDKPAAAPTRTVATKFVTR
jgi:hypothetical protein